MRFVASNSWLSWPLAAAYILLLSVASAGRAQEADAGAYVQAVWRTQQIDFHFKSETQRYRCAELGSRVRTILQPLADDIRVELQCLSTFASDLRATIVVTAAVVATEANVRVAREITPTQRLVARVRGDALPEGAIQPFTAQWREVSVGREGREKLEAADCEIVQALREQVLPLLPIRNLRVRGACGVIAQRPRLGAEALIRADPDLDLETRDAG